MFWTHKHTYMDMAMRHSEVISEEASVRCFRFLVRQSLSQRVVERTVTCHAALGFHAFLQYLECSSRTGPIGL